MEATRETVKAEMIARFEEIRKGLQEALSSPDVKLTSTPYIITVEGIPVNPEPVNGKYAQGAVRHGFPHTVRRFSYKEAQLVALNITNGRGVKGVPENWVMATKRKLAEIEGTLQFMTDLD